MRRMSVIALAVLACSLLASGAAQPPDLVNSVQLRIATMPVPPTKAQAAELKNLVKADPPLQAAMVIQGNLGGAADPADIPALLEMLDLFVAAAKSIEKSATQDTGIIEGMPALMNWCTSFGNWLADLIDALIPSLTGKEQEKLDAGMRKVSDAAREGDARWNAGEWAAGLKGMQKSLRLMAGLYEKYS